MSKTKILYLQIAGCVALGLIIGVGWWLCDGGKQENKISFVMQCDDTPPWLWCDGGKPDYKGVLDELRQAKPVLYHRNVMIPGTCTVFEKVTPVKIYQGKWRKEGYLEVIGK